MIGVLIQREITIETQEVMTFGILLKMLSSNCFQQNALKIMFILCNAHIHCGGENNLVQMFNKAFVFVIYDNVACNVSSLSHFCETSPLSSGEFRGDFAPHEFPPI